MGGGKVGGKRGSKEGTRPPPRGFQILRGLSSAGPSASVPLQFPLPQHHVRMFELAPHIMLAVLRPNHRSGAESGNPHSRIGLLIQNLGRRQTGDIFGMGTRGERATATYGALSALKPAINCGGLRVRSCHEVLLACHNISPTGAAAE